MDQKEILLLIKKYNEGNCSPEEIILLETWYVNQAQLFHQEIDEAKIEQDLNDIARKLPGIHRTASLLPRIAAAASILLFLSAGYYFISRKQPYQQVAHNQIRDIKPGGNKAVLTLAGGEQVVLTDAKSGIIAQQGNVIVKKTANGQVAYNANTASSLKSEVVAMNTITTPRGGKWSLTLSDGTKVWLNAASSITYPTAFTGNEREVAVSGEAYFEVVHNSARPFRVRVKGQTIEDIGTSFDVNAYNDEPLVKTTLLEGSVKVSNATGATVLKPGEQSLAKTGDVNQKLSVVDNADIEQTMAWKDGMFVFKRSDLHTLMRQISRWYDVDVVYEGKVKEDVFFGKIKQSNNLSKILNILELGDVHFRIDGKKIIVLP